MLKLSVNPDQSWSNFGIIVHSPPVVDNTRESPLWNPLISWFYNLAVPIGEYTYPDAYGYHDPKGPTHKESHSWKVSEGEFDEGRDFRHYGSLLDNVSFMLNGPSSYFSAENEHECDHRPYKGYLRTRLSPPNSVFSPLAVTRSVNGWNFVCPRIVNGYGQTSNDTGWYLNQAFLDAGTQRFTQIRTTQGFALWGVADKTTLDYRLSQYGSDYNFTSWAVFRIRFPMSKRQLTIDPDGSFHFSYELEHTHWGLYTPKDEAHTRRATVRHVIEGKVVNNVNQTFTHPALGTWLVPRSSPKVVVFGCRSTVLSASSFWEPTGWWVPNIGKTYESWKVFGHEALTPLDQPRTAYPIVLEKPYIPSFLKRHSSIRQQFYSNVGSFFPDIRTSALNSTADALSHADLSGNLENVVELRSMEFPDIRPLIEVVKGFGFNPNTIADLVNAATSLNLQWKFGLQPTIDFLINGLPELLNASSSPILVGRGKFSYEFPSHTFGRVKTLLTTRTKVQLMAPSSYCLSVLLDLRRLGLDPTISNVWNLVPLSFAADWIGSFGNRMARAEEILLRASSPIINLVHSYTVITPLEETEIQGVDPNLQSHSIPGSDPPHLRWYRREVSRRLPPIGYGRFDFGSPSQAPSWDLVGSFLYQFFGT